MTWTVESILMGPSPPELPPAPPAAVSHITRSIRIVQADNKRNEPVTLSFSGQSVSQLKEAIASHIKADTCSITLCVRAGSKGRLTPMFTDLPSDDQTMDIFVLKTDSEAAKALGFPDVDAH